MQHCVSASRSTVRIIKILLSALISLAVIYSLFSICFVRFHADTYSVGRSQRGSLNPRQPLLLSLGPKWENINGNVPRFSISGPCIFVHFYFLHIWEGGVWRQPHIICPYSRQGASFNSKIPDCLSSHLIRI
jgi:hypothetical protein